MARHAHPAKIARLGAVQRAKRSAAETALVLAREDEGRIAAEADARRDELAANQGLWFDYLGRPGFAPEFARAIAVQLVTSDAAAKDANQRHRLAIAHSEECVGDWRVAEARVRATGEELAAARRAEATRREEGRLAEFGDRVTYDWMTR